MIGRKAELGALVAAFERIDGERRPDLVLVSGEAGVGKSRLVSELGKAVAAADGMVLVGRCVEFGGQVSPLAPVRHVLQSLVDELDADALELVVGTARDGLSVLVPDLGGTAPVGSSAVNVSELSLGVLRRLARRQPVVVVVEDLHWADASTLGWVSTLAAADWLGPVMVVGTFRNDELHRRHPLLPLLAELARTARPQRVDVSRLDLDECRAMVSAIDGSMVDDDDAVDSIVRRSGGVPFFLEELVLAKAAGTESVSDVLREVVLARTSQLDDESVAVLHVVSAASSVSLEVLTAVSGLDGQTVTTILDELVATGLLVVADERIRFRHELGREVFECEILPGRRTRYHAQLASALEAHDPSRLGEIARHWSAAHDVRRAAEASIGAGRQAMGVGAPAEAEGHFGRALDLWDRVPTADRAAWELDRTALLMLAAAAAKFARRWDHAVDFARRAADEAGADANRAGAAWLQLSELYRHTRRENERLRAEALALNLLSDDPPSPERARALATAARSALWAGRDEDKRQFAAQALAVADACGDRDARIAAHYAMSIVLLSDGEFEFALASAQATVDMCDHNAAPESLMMALNGLTLTYRSVGQFEEVISASRRGVEVARRTGLGGPLASFLATKLVQSLVTLGRWEDAAQEASELRDVVDPGVHSGDWALASMFTQQGRFEAARDSIERVRLSPPDDPGHVPAWLIFHVEYMVTDRVAFDALALIDPLVDCYAISSMAFLIAFGVRALADQAEVAGPEVLGRIRRTAAAALPRWFARLDASLEMDVLDRIATDIAKAEEQRLNGVAASSSWESIASQCKEIGVPYFEAYARYRCGQAHLAGVAGRSAGAHRAAGQELTAAHAIAARLGAAPLRADIEALTRAANLTLSHPPLEEPRVDAAPNPFGLTSREREILDLIAQGRTNGEIGHELFISSRTASVHVSHILRKLSVSNRVEAASVAHRLHSAAALREGR
jgi:DNA-binding CsgD family transcriptional regulator/tetratricopeptide (TPR) repeat protein